MMSIQQTTWPEKKMAELVSVIPIIAEAIIVTIMRAYQKQTPNFVVHACLFQLRIV